MTPVPCARCKVVPDIELEAAGYGYVIHCRGCYDGAEDSSRRTELGFGSTREGAALDWAEHMDELAGDLEAGVKSTPLAYCLTLAVSK